MTPASETLVCPKGHLSTEADYCSECGAKLRGATEEAGPLPSNSAQICPDCGTAREQSEVPFCEVCGYNFVSGAHGELGIMPTTEPVESVEATEPATVDVPLASETKIASPTLDWQVTVTVDPTLRSAESPEAPEHTEPLTIALEHPVHLIGRRDEARGIFPEIALPLDEAVSRRHALLQQGGTTGMLLRDIGASNGTKLNGAELTPMVDYPVTDGDVITLGHWTRIVVHTQ